MRRGVIDNLIYKAYENGIYTVPENAQGHPLSDYSGFMIVMQDSAIKKIIKVLFLYNGWIYLMSQEYGTGKIVLSWRLIKGA